MSQGTVFAAPPEKFSFPRQEEATQLYWDKIDAFKESLRRSEGRKLWTFYDGPPFATGLPHYGHILAGTIKDIVCRYAHQTGHHVERRAGWDCHGLPVEYEIDQKLGIKSREDVLAMGIDKYNDECRAIVMRYSSQWVSTVTRMGRWIDFENDYKTMNIEFMVHALRWHAHRRRATLCLGGRARQADTALALRPLAGTACLRRSRCGGCSSRSTRRVSCTRASR